MNITVSILAIIILTITISIIFLLISLLIETILKKRKKRKDKIKKDISNNIDIIWDKYFKDIEIDLQPLEIIKERSLGDIIIDLPTYQTEDEVKKEIEEKFTELRKRIEEIENRFPKKSTVEKITSINDAVLATKLETLADSISKIENKMPTKWDIAKIVV